MANYENKLGEWFKQVEKMAEERAAKKKANVAPQVEPAPPVEPPRRSAPSDLAPAAGELATAVATAVETRESATSVLVSDEPRARTSEPRPVVQEPEQKPALFDEADIPPVEDFFSFLSRSSEPEESESTFEVPRDQGTLSLAEGTGEPRPITSAPAQPAPAPVVEQTPSPEPQQIEARAEVARPAPVVPETRPAPAPAPAIRREAPAPVDGASVQEKWDRLPRHLQTLFDGETKEVAQTSYKTFRETRGTLIERLLDPTISLEEAARILNVCPTTVRRYTNRGILRHYRTAGNQRRFKLSDVLTFMETNLRGRGAAEPDES